MQQLSADEIKSRWRDFSRNPLLSSTSVKSESTKLANGLRSIYWRIYFGVVPTPHSNSNAFNGWKAALARSRAEWQSLKEEYLRSPDGSWVNDGPSDGFVVNGSTNASGLRIDTNGLVPSAADANASNPLSLETSNPWKQWFADLELRKMLWQDVERTMPEVEYFREAKTQRMMVDLLHVWSRLNEGIGYRQGMHELLAHVLLVIEGDSLPAAATADGSDEMMHDVLDSRYIAHDTWAVFVPLMKSASAFYDSTPSVPLPYMRAMIGGIGSDRDKVTLVQPVVGQSVRIYDTLLQRMDPELFKKLESLQIEPQMWGIRWLCAASAIKSRGKAKLSRRRLLCSREFPTPLVLQLWDVLFAEDTSLRLIDQVCVAMLLRIRNRLLAADYSNALQLLLRYPSEVVPDTLTLARQALQLRDEPSPETAAVIHQENVSSGLGEVVDALPSMQSSQRRTIAHRRAESAATSFRRSAPELLAQGGAIAGSLAHNVFERAEALGLNKALGDLRRNVEAYQASMKQEAPTPTTAPARLPGRPSYNATMATIVNLAADILEKQSDTGQDRTATALQGLRHVASVLNGKTSEVEASFVAALQPVAVTASAAVPISKTSYPPTSPNLPSAGLSRASPTLLLSTRHDKPASSLSRSQWAVKAPVRTPSPKTPEAEVGGEALALTRTRSQEKKSGVPVDPLGAL